MTGRRRAAGPRGSVRRPVRPRGAWRVVLVLPHLAVGGAQRVATLMSSYWADRGHDVVLVAWMADGASGFFPAHPGVDLVCLPAQARRPDPDGPLTRARHTVVDLFEGPRQPGGVRPDNRSLWLAAPRAVVATWFMARRAVMRLLDAAIEIIARYRLLGRSGPAYLVLARAGYGSWRIRTLRRALMQIEPDVVISFVGRTNIFTVAASAGLPHRVVLSERNDPAQQRLGDPWDDLREVIYPGADVVTANSHGALASMRSYCPAVKLRFVPNPLVMPNRVPGAARRDAVLFLGRLEPQKAPEVLIEAFARFARAVAGWRLEVVGDGVLGEGLRQHVAAAGLAAAVTFHGFVADASPLLAACRIFVLPSRYEGTPNALLEAMAHGMACVVSDASPGPLQLIDQNVTGLVVETGSVAGLTDALAVLARDAALRDRLGTAASDRVREFGIDRVGPVWDRIVLPEASHGR